MLPARDLGMGWMPLALRRGSWRAGEHPSAVDEGGGMLDLSSQAATD